MGYPSTCPWLLYALSLRCASMRGTLTRCAVQDVVVAHVGTGHGRVEVSAPSQLCGGVFSHVAVTVSTAHRQARVGDPRHTHTVRMCVAVVRLFQGPAVTVMVVVPDLSMARWRVWAPWWPCRTLCQHLTTHHLPMLLSAWHLGAESTLPHHRRLHSLAGFKKLGSGSPHCL